MRDEFAPAEPEEEELALPPVLRPRPVALTSPALGAPDPAGRGGGADEERTLVEDDDAPQGEDPAAQTVGVEVKAGEVAESPVPNLVPQEAAPKSVQQLLDGAQEPGVLFSPLTEPPPQDLLAAVNSAQELLSRVAGVETIAPGKNDKGAMVVVISAARGFTEASLEAVPPEVDGFPTLVVIPFDLLPLRRER